MGITLENAQKVLEAMLKFASESKPGRPSSMAVVDNAANLVCSNRMDGAPPLTIKMALNKAYTAIDWGINTVDVLRMFFSGENARDVAWFGDRRHAPIPGGVLLKAEDGTIVGAVGTSGRTGEEDEELARVGEKAYQEMIKGS
ncbi:MAG: heme-binding protein [Desulfobacteraceae bacterium]|nr:heme-binding protein [Desulfobacteraceae bacterium]